MRHLTPITGRRDHPAVAGHPPEEIAKFLHEAITLFGDAVGLMSLLHDLRDDKTGNAS